MRIIAILCIIHILLVIEFWSSSFLFIGYVIILRIKNVTRLFRSIGFRFLLLVFNFRIIILFNSFLCLIAFLIRSITKFIPVLLLWTKYRSFLNILFLVCLVIDTFARAFTFHIMIQIINILFFLVPDKFFMLHIEMHFVSESLPDNEANKQKNKRSKT